MSPTPARAPQPKATYFATPAAFRAWLAKHHLSATELLVGFHKRDSGTPCMTWPESVDEALCHGWIDGVRRRVDDERYTIRFTPRRAGSTWSAINIRRVDELTKSKRMRPAGLKAFAGRLEHKSRTYAYEQKAQATLEAAHLATFKARAKAWAFFEAQPPWYKRTLIYWVVSAKQDATRLKRLLKLIEASANQKRLR